MDISNNEDTLDIRDVQSEIDDIQSEIDELTERLKPLKQLVEAVGDEVTLIRESYFTEYAQELAEELGLINRDNAWPACHIDWDDAAEALKIDYSSVDFDGVTYYYRQ